MRSMVSDLLSPPNSDVRIAQISSGELVDNPIESHSQPSTEAVPSTVTNRKQTASNSSSAPRHPTGHEVDDLRQKEWSLMENRQRRRQAKYDERRLTGDYTYARLKIRLGVQV
ncbi:hypothetical protein P152DRAFT_461324 [Eremomyces bilateralis CBS 781.70]|uniref:Uncharacterized protein n=1 Tax=Eremomyces bilateralis CBS 781.70 TaxID=1392243 RepID=A0A6G1FV99_9PEZI|nr:uncharacterized protein P152DRAFT_461324 [Eremomyces bilateralis CBS 781.70]KAF1809636.1 hypothetical protein P152DRAFT_461324 [Eremomyces bilateralis CBS 781.70]